MVVRLAQPGDERGLAVVRVRGWQEGYVGIVDAAFLASLSVDDSEQRWSTVLENRGPLRHVLVADVGSSDAPEVVGYSTFGPYRITTGDDRTMEVHELAAPGTIGEVYGFYVRPDHWGSEVANNLMDATLSTLGTDGWPFARLWVLKDNPRARRFYERHGWIADGAETSLAIVGNPTECRYQRGLGKALSSRAIP
jgi:ribosomal protein S18 acetylase RimI-like enzyme